MHENPCGHVDERIVDRVEDDHVQAVEYVESFEKRVAGGHPNKRNQNKFGKKVTQPYAQALVRSLHLLDQYRVRHCAIVEYLKWAGKHATKIFVSHVAATFIAIAAIVSVSVISVFVATSRSVCWALLLLLLLGITTVVGGGGGRVVRCLEVVLAVALQIRRRAWVHRALLEVEHVEVEQEQRIGYGQAGRSWPNEKEAEIAFRIVNKRNVVLNVQAVVEDVVVECSEIDAASAIV